MKNQFKHLVALQYDLNVLINPEWIENALNETYDYRTAASQEVGEAMESLGYAWWTHRELDMQNVRSELVDALHLLLGFNIAHVNSACADKEAITELLSERIPARYTAVVQEPSGSIIEVRKLIRSLQAKINVGTFGEIWEAFFAVIKALGFSADHLYARSLAKNILNNFRQDNGYRQNLYLKTWNDGREDSSHVASYVDEVVEGGNEFNAEEFRTWLAATYAEHYRNEQYKSEANSKSAAPVQQQKQAQEQDQSQAQAQEAEPKQPQGEQEKPQEQGQKPASEAAINAAADAIREDAKRPTATGKRHR